jgi:hypothetical protein
MVKEGGKTIKIFCRGYRLRILLSAWVPAIRSYYGTKTFPLGFTVVSASIRQPLGIFAAINYCK